jgi:putative ABC transport system permease protein
MVIFPTSYQNTVNGPTGLGVIPDQYFVANPDLKVSQDAVAAMMRTRTGILIDSGLADKYGWKVGDHVPLKSRLWLNREGTSLWQFDIVGTFKPTKSTSANDVFLINYDFLDEGRNVAKGTTSFFSFRISNPADASAISNKIDSLFANSPHETTTTTAERLAQEQMKQIGDVGFVVNAIAGAVFFSLLFYIGTGMAQSVRERTPELGTLKAIGFSDRAVLVLIVGESLLVCVTGALIGLGLVSVLFPMAATAAGLPIAAQGVATLGVAMAVGLALVGGLPSAIRAMRLSVVDALAGK